MVQERIKCEQTHRVGVDTESQPAYSAWSLSVHHRNAIVASYHMLSVISFVSDRQNRENTHMDDR